MCLLCLSYQSFLPYTSTSVSLSTPLPIPPISDLPIHPYPALLSLYLPPFQLFPPLPYPSHTFHTHSYPSLLSLYLPPSHLPFFPSHLFPPLPTSASHTLPTQPYPPLLSLSLPASHLANLTCPSTLTCSPVVPRLPSLLHILNYSTLFHFSHQDTFDNHLLIISTVTALFYSSLSSLRSPHSPSSPHHLHGRHSLPPSP